MNAGEGKGSTLASDIDPISRCRLPLVQREDLDEAGRQVFDATAANQRSIARLRGPAGIRLHSSRSRELEYLRYETELGRRLTELAILVAAREMDQQFEWTLHEQEALKEGLEPQIIDIVRHRRAVEGLGSFRQARASDRNGVHRRRPHGDQGHGAALGSFFLPVAIALGHWRAGRIHD